MKIKIFNIDCFETFLFIRVYYNLFFEYLINFDWSFLNDWESTKCSNFREFARFFVWWRSERSFWFNLIFIRRLIVVNLIKIVFMIFIRSTIWLILTFWIFRTSFNCRIIECCNRKFFCVVMFSKSDESNENLDLRLVRSYFLTAAAATTILSKIWARILFFFFLLIKSRCSNRFFISFMLLKKNLEKTDSSISILKLVIVSSRLCDRTK